MADARWIRLLAELRADRRAWEAQLAELDLVRLSGPPFDKGELARVALALDHGYSAVEALLARVTRTLEQGAAEGPSWHRDLLRLSTLELPGLRPPLVGDESAQELARLLAFRHFLRHAYSTPLDGDALLELRGRALALAPGLAIELERVEAWIEQVAASG